MRQRSYVAFLALLAVWGVVAAAVVAAADNERRAPPPLLMRFDSFCNHPHVKLYGSSYDPTDDSMILVDAAGVDAAPVVGAAASPASSSRGSRGRGHGAGPARRPPSPGPAAQSLADSQQASLQADAGEPVSSADALHVKTLGVRRPARAAGGMFLRRRVDLSAAWTTLFRFSLDWQQDPGGDGFALVLAPHLPDAMSTGGGRAGKSVVSALPVGGAGYTQLLGGLALEFDAQSQADIDGQGEAGSKSHVSVHTASGATKLISPVETATSFRALGGAAANAMRDGRVHAVNVTYVPASGAGETQGEGQLLVSLDGADAWEWSVTLSAEQGFAESAGTGAGAAGYLGFTTATSLPGALTHIHGWQLYGTSANAEIGADGCLHGFAGAVCRVDTAPAAAACRVAASCPLCTRDSQYCCAFCDESGGSSTAGDGHAGTVGGSDGACRYVGDKFAVGMPASLFCAAPRATLRSLFSCAAPGDNVDASASATADTGDTGNRGDGDAGVQPRGRRGAGAGAAKVAAAGESGADYLPVLLFCVLLVGVCLPVAVYLRWRRLDASEKLFFFQSSSHCFLKFFGGCACLGGRCVDPDRVDDDDGGLDETAYAGACGACQRGRDRLALWMQGRGTAALRSSRVKHRYVPTGQEDQLDEDDEEVIFELELAAETERMNLMVMDEAIGQDFLL